MISLLLCLTYLTQYDTLYVHPYCSKWPYFILFDGLSPTFKSLQYLLRVCLIHHHDPLLLRLLSAGCLVHFLSQTKEDTLVDSGSCSVMFSLPHLNSDLFAKKSISAFME